MKKLYPIYAVPEAGAVLIRKNKNRKEVLLVHRVKQRDVSLPKGHVEPSESLGDTVIREIKEETGYDIDLGEYIDSFEYEFIEKEAEKIHWVKVYWFLAKPSTITSKIHNPGEIKKIEWVELSIATKLLSYDNDREILSKAKLMLG